MTIIIIIIINDNCSTQMAEEDCGLCMFPDLQDKSNNFSVVDGLSIVTSRKFGPLLLLIFERCKYSIQLI